jgi:DNA mismatch endonuclease (patch repair protein)
MPKTRVEFWKKKFHDNIKRDKKVVSILEKDGWKVVVIWEDETEHRESLRCILQSRLN